MYDDLVDVAIEYVINFLGQCNSAEPVSAARRLLADLSLVCSFLQIAVVLGSVTNDTQ